MNLSAVWGLLVKTFLIKDGVLILMVGGIDYMHIFGFCFVLFGGEERPKATYLGLFLFCLKAVRPFIFSLMVMYKRHGCQSWWVPIASK